MKSGNGGGPLISPNSLSGKKVDFYYQSGIAIGVMNSDPSVANVAFTGLNLDLSKYRDWIDEHVKNVDINGSRYYNSSYVREYCEKETN